jgi:rhamnosyltransferase subunit B
MSNKYHVLLTAVGSSGDVNHFAGIGSILKHRGHRVTLIANGAFASLATAAGLNFEEVGSAESYNRIMADPRIADWRSATRLVVREGLLRKILPYYERVLKLHEPGCTVLVSNGAALGARIAQDELELPGITVLVTPALLRSMYSPPRHTPLPMLRDGRFREKIYSHAFRLADYMMDRALNSDVNGLRLRIGLPSVKRILSEWWLSPQGVLALWPDWFAPPQRDWPSQVRVLGFPLYDGERNDSSYHPTDVDVDAALRSNDGLPPILFTAGSFAAHNKVSFDVASKACQLLGRRGIFLSKESLDVLQRLPSHMTHINRFVPLSTIAPRVAAMVHHGGIGTSSFAFASGIPQVITPLAHDMFDNAERIQRLGVGRSLKVSNTNPTGLAKALSELLGSPDVRVRCRRLQESLNGGSSLPRVCDFIEEVAQKCLGRGEASVAATNSPSNSVTA